MDTERMEKLKNDLLEFVSRATKKDAIPEEVAILPEVVRLLAKILGVIG